MLDDEVTGVEGLVGIAVVLMFDLSSIGSAFIYMHEVEITVTVV